MNFITDHDVDVLNNEAITDANLSSNANFNIANNEFITSRNWTTNLTHLTADLINNTLLQPANDALTIAATIAAKMMNSSIPPIVSNVTKTVLDATASAIVANSSSSSSSNYDGGSGSGITSQIYPDSIAPIRLEHAPQLSKSALIKVYVLSLMAIISLFGNVATMWNIYKTRMARRNSRHTWSAIYSLMFHLSIADLLVTGFCIIGEAAWYYTVQWVADELTCKLVKLFQMFSLYLSTYVLVLIGVDRWIAVKYPMKSLNMAKRCYRLLGGTYVLSLVLSLPQFFIFHISKGPFIEEFHQCVTHGFYSALWQEQLYATFTMIFTFLLPLCILFGTYLSTFRTISGSEKMFQGSKLAVYSNKPTMQTNRQRLIHKAKMKSMRISVVIIFAFLICWTPYNVMMSLFMFSDPDNQLGEDLQQGIFFFGMSNSIVNPLIYGAFHLCPMKRKASKYGGHPNSLTRGDSQRTPSLLTAVTQVDNNCRPGRTFRQASYYRSHSNGSNYKEHVGLLQSTPTTLKKSASVRSPLPSHHLHHHHHHHHHQMQHHNPNGQLLIESPPLHTWGVTTQKTNTSGATSTITTMNTNSGNATNLTSGSLSTIGWNAPKENVSSV